MTLRTPDNHYEHPTLAAVYDVTCGWSEDRDYYLALANREGMAVLDIGCGTGLLCDAFARRGHLVVGVDPSATMLDVARRQPNGSQVQWVQGYAQTFESDQRFDLAIMTGHAFQTLLNLEEVSAALTNIHAHLRPGGRFVFESRNPAIDWPALWHGRLTQWDSEFGPFTQLTEVTRSTQNKVWFEHRYEFESETLGSSSELWFPSQQTIETALSAAGFKDVEIHGEWDGSAFDPSTSLEMIFSAQA